MHKLFRIAAAIGITSLLLPQLTAGQSYEMALGYRRDLNKDWIGYNGQNMIRDSLGWVNPYLMKNLPSLYPKNLRYPGGGLANWWDWHKGWFVTASNLPSAYVGLKKLPNTLENFKKVIDSCHANPILVLNMISSDLQDQLDMLRHADDIGLSVEYIELGNEFYLEGGDDSVAILEAFPTAESYAITASEWCDSIHKYFPDSKVAAQGAYNRNNATRRITWDEGMLPYLHGEDVISYHTYMSAAAADEAYTDTSTFTTADLPEMLFRPFKMWQILSTEDLPLVPSGNEVWITEYNLRDKTRPTQGCWAHGLFTATQTMQFLNDTRIKHLMCHSMDGTAVDGALFFTADGYDYGSAGHFTPPPHAPASTQYWGKTACGTTMALLGYAVKGMNYASPLEFDGQPLITATDNGVTVQYPSVYGWAFSNNDSTQAVVVNLSPNDVKINTQGVFPSGGKYERYDADPLLYVAYERDINHKTNTTLPGTLTLKAYSITRMYAGTVPGAPPTVSMTANGSTKFCDGDSVQLNAGGGYADYLWSTGETTQKIWAKQDGDTWVRVRSKSDGYWAADTLHITVHALPAAPVISNIPNTKFCVGDSLLLSVKFPDDGMSYVWSNGDEGTTATAFTGGDYTVTATDQYGCQSVSAPATLKTKSLPSPVITASGPTEICWDQSVTLDAGSGFKSYAWSNGKVGQTITVSTSGTYSCTVKNNSNCYGTSGTMSVTVHTPADPVITITGPTTFCTGTTPCTLKANSGYNYQWQKGGTDISGATGKKYVPADNGNYRFILTDDFGCTKKSDPASITVNKPPHTGITVNGDKKICVPSETVKLTLETCSNCNYQWQLLGLDIPGATDKNYWAAVAGDFTYEVTDKNGCTATSNPVTIINTCLKEAADAGNSAASLSLYPNPAASIVHIRATLSGGDEEALLVVRNLLGEEVTHTYTDVNEGTAATDLDVSMLTDGVYLVILKSGSQTLQQQLVIGRH